MASETALIVLGAGGALAFVVYLHYKRKNPSGGFAKESAGHFSPAPAGCRPANGFAPGNYVCPPGVITDPTHITQGNGAIIRGWPLHGQAAKPDYVLGGFPYWFGEQTNATQGLMPGRK